MRVALTGTPGVGKTTLAAAAAQSGHGWRVVDVKAFARSHGAVAGRDEADDADVLDVDILASAVAVDGDARRNPGNVIYEGHLAHLLPVDVAWVLRCDPDVLAPRLRARGYAQAKVVENLEAEALDIILQEALDHAPRVVQRDATRRSAAELLASFEEASRAAAGPADIEPVDWSDRLPIQGAP